MDDYNISEQEIANINESLKICYHILKRISQHPNEVRFRKLKFSNSTIKKRIIDQYGVVKLLSLAGFQKVMNDYYLNNIYFIENIIS